VCMVSRREPGDYYRMTFQREVYAIPGVIDRSVFQQEAEVRFHQSRERTLIHVHRYDRLCTDDCTLWPVPEPEPKEEPRAQG